MLKAGDILLVNDGQLRFEVTAVSVERIETSALVVGVISDRKGVNVSSAALPLPALSEKDTKDLAFGLEIGVD